MAKMSGHVTSRSAYLIDLFQTSVNNSEYFLVKTLSDYPCVNLEGCTFLINVSEVSSPQREERTQVSISKPQWKPSSSWHSNLFTSDIKIPNYTHDTNTCKVINLTKMGIVKAVGVSHLKQLPKSEKNKQKWISKLGWFYINQ